MTLKLLSFSPSGAVIAAPSTSLPEKIGGVRNWDYRFCWLRDAAMTIRAFFHLGYKQEAEAFLAWTLHSTQLSRPDLQVVYDVYGETDIREKELEGLDGYASSGPVRAGNDARNQLQLDIYGEVVVAVFEFSERGGSLDRDTRRMLLNIGRIVCRRRHEPDDGIWELRSGRRHNTYSKAMCWVVLDLLIRMHRKGLIVVPEQEFLSERNGILSEIEERGFSEKLGSYVSHFAKADVDGSLLLLPIYGYSRFRDERVIATCRRIQEVLGENGLIYRYLFDDGLPPGRRGIWGLQLLGRGMRRPARRKGGRTAPLRSPAWSYTYE